MEEAANEQLNLLITLNEIRQALATFQKLIRSTKKCYEWLEAEANSTKILYSSINEKQAALGNEGEKLLQLIDDDRSALYERTPFIELSDELQRNLELLNNRMYQQSGRILPWLCCAKPFTEDMPYKTMVPLRIAIMFEGVVDENLFPRFMYIDVDDFVINHPEGGYMFYRFSVSTIHPKLVNSALLIPSDFEMHELIRVLMEYGGLGWSDLMKISLISLNNYGQKSWLNVF